MMSLALKYDFLVSSGLESTSFPYPAMGRPQCIVTWDILELAAVVDGRWS